MKYKLKWSLHDLVMSGISLLVIVILIIVSYFSLPKSLGNEYAVVRYHNEIVAKMPLNKDAEFIMYKSDYEDLYGDELIVTVKGGKVFISKEDSPFHYCSYLGEIQNVGSSLICVPNCVRVTIESVEGNSNVDNEVDIIPGV